MASRRACEARFLGGFAKAGDRGADAKGCLLKKWFVIGNW
jgi:hypothetical protein